MIISFHHTPGEGRAENVLLPEAQPLQPAPLGPCTREHRSAGCCPEWSAQSRDPPRVARVPSPFTQTLLASRLLCKSSSGSRKLLSFHILRFGF